jgi:AraC-like DNA-binding protein
MVPTPLPSSRVMDLAAATTDRRDPQGSCLPVAVARTAAGSPFRLESAAFKCLFLLRGVVPYRLGGASGTLVGPCALSLDERESPEFPEGAEAIIVAFLPELLNGSLSVDKLRGCPRSLDVSAELDLYWAAAYLDRPAGGLRPIPLDTLSASRLEQWFGRLADELDSQTCRFWKAWARSYLSEVLFALGSAWHSLVQGGDAGGSPAGLQIAPPREADPMAAVVSYLHENHCRSDISLDTLSRHFATNRTSLQLAFRDYTGRSVIDYLRLYRLSMSRGYLEATRRTVTEIGQSVGFRDITGYERAFARAYGLSPGAYRKLLQG